MTAIARTRRFATFLALALIAGCGSGGPPAGERTADAPIPVEVEPAAISDVDEHLEIVGDVMPWQVQPLSFKVAGKIARLFIEEGDLVERNQLVAVLDTVDYRLVRDLADAQVEGLRPNLERASALKEKEAVTASQLDELQSRMLAAKIQRTQAATQLSYSWLRAPAAGVVVKRMMSEGDLTDAAHPVAAIAELKRVKVILPVTQRDLPLFRVKSVVSFTVPDTGRIYEGSIFSVGYAADERTRTFPVALEVSNADLELRAGMVIEARVRAATHRGIFVPLDAVHRDFEGHPIVFVAAGAPAKAAQRRVELGVLVGERAQIVSGLAPGDAVIVRGMVQGGEPVAIVAAPAEAAADGGSAR
jgi:membrane fusion protein, multidrug efflux system